MNEPAVSSAHGASYTLVFAGLVVLTALELAASYLPFAAKLPLLVLFALTKASLVILFFMHVRYDKKIFFIFFAIGLVLTIPLMLVLGLVMPPLH
ncbi:MAG: cytochrome C oxidase subunit IV family protein [Anaerolineales bacterium]|jgi:cytochrome c oxidase subunit 4